MFVDSFNEYHKNEIKSSLQLHKTHCRMSKRQRTTPVPASLQLHGDSCDDTDGSASHCEDDWYDSHRPLPVPWSNELHQDFVRAVLKIGIEKSSPAVIAEQMITKNNYNAPDQPPENTKESGQSETTRKPKRKGSPYGRKSSATADQAIEGEPADEHEYYKRELTGERLKSHLQKVRKQTAREMEIFLKEHKRFLGRQASIKREQEKLKQQEEDRKAEVRRRRKRKRRRIQRIRASSFDSADRADATKDEEERLLSLYLPPPTADGNGGKSLEQLEQDLEDGDGGARSAFPAGGDAIGRVTWAVQQEQIETRKRKEERRDRQAKRRAKHPKLQKLSPSQGEQDGQSDLLAHTWEIDSVNSWTSDTAIVAGKVASALGHVRRGMADTKDSPKLILSCGSSEDEYTSSSDSDSEDEDEEDGDMFRAIVPTLSEAERKSPLGVSMMLAWDMIKHMHGVISEQRQESSAQEQQVQPPPTTSAAAITPVAQSEGLSLEDANPGSAKDPQARDQAGNAGDGPPPPPPHEEPPERKPVVRVSSPVPSPDHQQILIDPVPSPVRVTESAIPAVPSDVPSSIMVPTNFDGLSNPNLVAAMAMTGPPPAGLGESLERMFASFGPSAFGVPVTAEHHRRQTSSVASNFSSSGSSCSTIDSELKWSVHAPLLRKDDPRRNCFSPYYDLSHQDHHHDDHHHHTTAVTKKQGTAHEIDQHRDDHAHCALAPKHQHQDKEYHHLSQAPATAPEPKDHYHDPHRAQAPKHDHHDPAPKHHRGIPDDVHNETLTTADLQGHPNDNYLRIFQSSSRTWTDSPNLISSNPTTPTELMFLSRNSWRKNG